MKIVILFLLFVVITSALELDPVEPEKAKGLIDILTLNPQQIVNDVTRDKRQYGQYGYGSYGGGYNQGYGGYGGNQGYGGGGYGGHGGYGHGGYGNGGYGGGHHGGGGHHHHHHHHGR